MPTLREPPAPPKVPAYDEHRRLGPNKLTRHVGQRFPVTESTSPTSADGGERATDVDGVWDEHARRH